MVKCPNCSEKTTHRLMVFEKPRTFDEEKQLPVTLFECKFCNTKMRFIGPVCIDCAGFGRLQTDTGRGVNIDTCKTCAGKGCHSEFIEIEWGEKPIRIRSHYEQEMFDEGTHAFNQRQAIKQHLKETGTQQCRGGYFCKGGNCHC